MSRALLNQYIPGGGFLIWDQDEKPIKVTLEEHPTFKCEQDAIDDGYYKCKKCNAIGDDVHSCWNCDIELCVDCDENEMPAGADDHTYCTPCVGKLFTDKDYDPELYETDFVLYWIDTGEFEFEKHNYPYIYNDWSNFSAYRDEQGIVLDDIDVKDAWIPCTELPQDKKELLIKMLRRVL
tara:strand:- start:8885 stop:9424 length:540 start_codon:yes stop_codon:yes gene_type:complete